jgi:hypothetical protein
MTEWQRPELMFEWVEVGGRLDAVTAFGRGDLRVWRNSDGTFRWSAFGCNRSQKHYQTSELARAMAEKWLIQKCRAVVEAETR